MTTYSNNTLQMKHSRQNRGRHKSSDCVVYDLSQPPIGLSRNVAAWDPLFTSGSTLIGSQLLLSKSHYVI